MLRNIKSINTQITNIENKIDNLYKVIKITHKYSNTSSFAIRIGNMIIFWLYINISNNGGVINGIIATIDAEISNAHITPPIAYDYTMPQRLYKTSITSNGDISLTASVTDRPLGVIMYGILGVK